MTNKELYIVNKALKAIAGDFTEPQYVDQETNPESGDEGIIELRVALGQALLRMKQVEQYKRCERQALPSCLAAIELIERQFHNLAALEFNVQSKAVCVTDIATAISTVFIPDGVWNIEEGMKLKRAANAVLKYLADNGYRIV
jgi:hypothetical protein